MWCAADQPAICDMDRTSRTPSAARDLAAGTGFQLTAHEETRFPDETGFLMNSAYFANQTEKLLPQPQLLLTLGLLNVNPRFSSPS